MAKNILILNGSPRANGNTERMADALIEGAESAGNTATKINLRGLNIRPCIGCFQCMNGKGNPCIQQDDMQKIYDAFAQADTIIFASPVYFWHLTAQIKTVLDRMLAIGAATQLQMPKRDCALLAPAGDKLEAAFPALELWYRDFLIKHLGWNDKGVVFAPEVNEVGEIDGTKYLDEARKLGASL